MGGTLKDFLKRQFPGDGLGWKIPSLVAALIAIGLSLAAAWLWLRDALWDFMTADVEVWHLLLSVLAAGITGVWWTSRAGKWTRRAGKRKPVRYPDEVKVFGVIWPIETVIAGGTPEFHAGPPACPKHRNPLGHAVEGEVSYSLVHLDDLPWRDLVAQRMRLGCFKDGTIYDLTKFGGMRAALRVAEGEAQGIYRTALAEVRGEDEG